MNSLIKFTVIILFCLTGSLLWVDNTSGGKPIRVTVTAADPEFALQGQNLDVTVIGSGFDDGSTIRFLVADSSDDTQVEVIGEIQHIKESGKPEKLIVPIHVLNAAPKVYYDIEVRTSSGRRGKGTDMFRVQENGGSANRNETGPAECNDTIDNDGDGFIDGEDPDCYNSYDHDLPKSSTTNIHEALIVTLDDGDSMISHDLMSDGNRDYVDGESHVNAFAGGSIPHRLKVAFQGGGPKNRRAVTVRVVCEPIPTSSPPTGDVFGRCGQLATDFADISEIGPNPDALIFTGGYHFTVTPYTVNCPETSTPPCPDVFTMGEGPTLMSLKLSSGIHPNIEAASDIGGGSVIDPGRCLSLMTNAQRTAFIENNCTEEEGPSNCNVTVRALDEVDQDEQNDYWRIEATGIKALICKDGIVYGQTTLTLGYDAVTK